MIDPGDVEDDFAYLEVKLGAASVRIGYVIVHKIILIQGAEINGEWVDIESFSQGVYHEWRRDIERELEKAE